MKKRYIVLLVVIAMLALSIAFPFLQAAYQMKEYLQVIDPHFASYVKLFAVYNPVDDAFNMRIIDDSDASIFLECVSDGLIIDEIRTNKYLEEHSIPTYFSAEDESVGHLSCYWEYDSPNEPLFILSVYRGNRFPVADEAQLEKALKTRMLTHYQQLPDIVMDRLLRCHIHHQTDSVSYRITVNITDTDDFTALLDQAEVAKEELDFHS